MNHRMGQRVSTNRSVSLYIPVHGWVDGQMVNISLTGAAIRCREWKSLEPCMPVEVRLEPCDDRQPEQVNLHGFVVRLQRGMVGMMFMRDNIDLINRLRPCRSEQVQLDNQAMAART